MSLPWKSWSIIGVAFAQLMSFSLCCVLAADDSGSSGRIRLIAGQTDEKGYVARLEAVRALEKGPALSAGERVALLAFLRRADNDGGTGEMEAE